MPLPIDVATLFGLHGRVAFITGCAEGIGREIARYYASAGATVALADVNFDGIQTLAKELEADGVTALAIRMDQADEGQIKDAIKKTADRFGRLDVLANNAGIQDRAFFEDTTADMYDKIYRVNMRGPFLCMREAAEVMKAGGRGGAIVNTGSIGGTHPQMRGLVAYNSTKAAIHSITKQAAFELGVHNIRANAILPGAVPTEGSSRAPGPLEVERLKAKLPLPAGRLGAPSDMAAGALYLASDAAAFVTGALLVIDGGMTLL